MAEFTVATETSDGGATIVAVSGEVDLATAPEMRAALLAVTGDLTVDMAAVSFMDSTGLSALISAQKRTAAAGHRFTVTNESDIVARTMELTGLYAVLHSNPTESP
jgi:anti-anti-sigma factor